MIDEAALSRRRVGVVADTHGLIRPALVDALQGVDRIIHAGDVGAERVLVALEAIAPVVAVRGNVDREGRTGRLRYRETVVIGAIVIYVVHDLAELDLKPVAANVRVVVSGHTHVPACSEKNGVLYLNPGSAGPRRANRPVSMALLEIDGDGVEPRFVQLIE